MVNIKEQLSEFFTSLDSGYTPIVERYQDINGEEFVLFIIEKYRLNDDPSLEENIVISKDDLMKWLNNA